jgi:hypothetical protein
LRVATIVIDVQENTRGGALTTPSRLVVLFLAVSLTLFFFTRQSQISLPKNKVPRGTLVELKKKSVQERYRYYEERDRFEFDQLKDPRTGKIPRNIRQQELEWAKRQPVRPESDNPLTGNVYTALGPNNLGGRTRAIAYDKTTPTIMLAGGISSGIFRTASGGTTWTNVTPVADIHNVTSIAQDPRTGSTTTWYYATGEAIGNSASETGGTYRGHGIWKSVDNGVTWSLLGATSGTLESFDSPFDYVSKIVVDPTNGNVYAAAQRVIMRSVDGGTTWSAVLGEFSGSSSTGITDIAVSSTGRFYAAFAGNAGTNSASGLPPSTEMDGVWTSTTGASGSWTKIAGTGSATTPTGWNTAGSYGRVVLALAPSNEDVLYILYDNDVSSSCAGTAAVEADFFKWTQSTMTGVDRTANLPDEAGCLDGNDPFAIQGGYDLVVAVKPDDENFVVIGGTNAYRSTDGFATTGFTTRIGGYAGTGSYAKYTTHHPDIHALVFHPTTSTTMVCSDDGGIQVTTDITAGTVVWTSLNNDYVTYQYYHVALDPTLASLVAIGGTQDNGTTHTTGGSTSHTEVFGGDGVAVGISASNTWHYLGAQNGLIFRRDPTDPPGFATDIKPTGTGSGIFVTYFYLNPDNTEHLYYANSTALFRTTSASTVAPGTWTNMTGFSSTLTGSIRALATSRQAYTTSHKLYCGTSDGKIYRLNDPANAAAATVPTDITGAAMPAGANVSGIAVDPSDDKKMMVTFSNYSVTSIWYTDDASVATPTWTAVEGTLTLPSVRACLIVTRNGFPTEYYVGTSVGLYSTAALSGGTTTWTQEGPGTIRRAVVRSFAYRYSDNRMLVGTHGNGMFYADVPNPLPVQLASFTARVVNNSSVRLDWRTLSEINNYGFFVERKRESDAAFVEVPNSFTPGHGTTNEPHDYSFTDANVPSGRWSYRLRQVDLDNTIHYSEPVNVSVLTSVAEGGVPSTFALHQNYPNPFNPSTTIQFDLPQELQVKLNVYNSAGQLVASLVNERRQAGTHRVTFTATNLASGMYLYRLEAENFVQTRKLLLVR